MKGGRKNIIPLALTLFFIAFVTQISRTPTLSRVTHLVPLWSYIPILSGKNDYGRQILLNILLFIPLGYFLRSLFRTLPVILISLVVSACVEVVQFLTYRGMLDIDDLISNGLGTAAGILLFSFTEKKCGEMIRAWLGRGLIVAGLVGCVMVAAPSVKSNLSTHLTRQFWLDATTAITGDKLLLEGSCYTYERATPSYTLLLDGVEQKTDVNGDIFTAVAPLPEQKSELKIRFSGYNTMPTGIYISPDGGLDYVEEDVRIPEGVPKTAILKAYSLDYDTLVFEDGDRILWLIGWERLDENTEIIYHIHTNEPEKLPENRVQYKFDNRGFRGKETAKNELSGIENYRVFEKEFPTEYNVTAIVVGLNTEGTITWTASFRPEKRTS